MPDSALPSNLRGKRHWDYPWPLSLIPRGWTAFKWGAPKLVAGRGNAFTDGWYRRVFHYQAPKPIDPPGGWQLSRFPDGPWFAWYFAFTLPNGWHFRIGARWDDVDNYIQFPTVGLRHLPPERTDTSTGQGR